MSLSGGALHHLAEMLPGLHIDAKRMLKNLDATHGLIFAEAVTMALGDRLGKMPAHMLVELACKRARLENRHLKDVLRGEPEMQVYLTAADLERLFDVRNYLGSTEEFVRRVREFKIRGSSGKLNIALDGLPRFPAIPAESAAGSHQASSPAHRRTARRQ